MAIRLEVVEGLEAGRVFEFARHEMFLVGRGDETHFRLSPEDRYCSRLHFMVEVNPPHCRLWDMESNNGTFVNGQRVEGCIDLRDGDQIRAGRTTLLVRLLPDLAPSDAAESEAPSAGLTLPESPLVYPGYSLGAEVGRGNMGIVYRGVDERDGELVAIKTILPTGHLSDRAIRRFLREARVLSRLSHPHIVRYLTMGVASGRLYFVMEFVEGPNLLQVMQSNPLPVRIAVGIACQVLSALEYAHGEGFVHRDIKPSNVLLPRVAGGKSSVRVADFGLARVYQASRLSGLTLQGDLGGTPLYAAPEQLLNFREAAPASDQYSTGMLLYELLCGDLPFPREGNLPQVVARVIIGGGTPLATRAPELPPGLTSAVQRAIARDPGDRFQDVREFREALLPYRS